MKMTYICTIVGTFIIYYDYIPNTNVSIALISAYSAATLLIVHKHHKLNEIHERP
jgi:hypothetical protein